MKQNKANSWLLVCGVLSRNQRWVHGLYLLRRGKTQDRIFIHAWKYQCRYGPPIFWRRNKGSKVAEKMLRMLRVHWLIQNSAVLPLWFIHFFSSNIQMSCSMNNNNKKITRVFCTLQSHPFTTEFYCFASADPLDFPMFLLPTSASLTSTSSIYSVLLLLMSWQFLLSCI